MANRPKQMGTARETAIVRAHEAVGLEARRDATNSECSDVIVRTRAGNVRIEAKDRMNLNAHKLMKQMGQLYPDDFNILWWHRTSRKNGNARKSPDGPDLVHMTADDWLQVARLLDRVGAALDEWAHGPSVDVRDDLEFAGGLLEWIGEAVPERLKQ